MSWPWQIDGKAAHNSWDLAPVEGDAWILKWKSHVKDWEGVVWGGFTSVQK